MMANNSWPFRQEYELDPPCGMTCNAEDAIGWMTSSGEPRSTSTGKRPRSGPLAVPLPIPHRQSTCLLRSDRHCPPSEGTISTSPLPHDSPFPRRGTDSPTQGWPPRGTVPFSQHSGLEGMKIPRPLREGHPTIPGGGPEVKIVRIGHPRPQEGEDPKKKDMFPSTPSTRSLWTLGRTFSLPPSNKSTIAGHNLCERIGPSETPQSSVVSTTTSGTIPMSADT